MWTLFAVIVPIQGCPADPRPEPTALGSWVGRFTSDDGCSDGTVELYASAEEDGSWMAYWDYRSDAPGDPDDGAHARYTLLGGGTGTRLSMSSVDREADALVDGVWCNGNFTFHVAPRPGYGSRLLYRSLGWDPPPDTLYGQWTATDCTCTGTIELTRKPERYFDFTF